MYYILKSQKSKYSFFSLFFNVSDKFCIGVILIFFWHYHYSLQDFFEFVQGMKVFGLGICATCKY